MSNIIENSKDVIMEGLESLKNIKKDKAEYRAHVARIKELPEDFRYVFAKITEYMWSNSGGGDGYDMITLQAGLLELFETGAAEGKKVLEITGEDVATFADDLLRGAHTYAEKCRAKLNRKILKHIEK